MLSTLIPQKLHGVYDISNDTYHSSIGINRSALMEFSKSPFHYWNKYLNNNSIKTDQSTKAMEIGSMIHLYILEPEKFDNEYLVIEKHDGRTTKGRKYYDDMNVMAMGRKLITQEDFEYIKSMRESIYSNKQIVQLIEGGQYEKSIYWTDPDTKLLCKVRPDIWQNNFIADLKTSKNAGYYSFQRSIYEYGYHIQCAMIHEAFKHGLNIDMRDFIFIVAENFHPFAPAVYQFDDVSLDRSVDIFKTKLFELNKCMESNKWPSYETKIISLPSYIGE